MGVPWSVAARAAFSSQVYAIRGISILNSWATLLYLAQAII